jgi:hypothetical protein
MKRSHENEINVAVEDRAMEAPSSRFSTQRRMRVQMNITRGFHGRASKSETIRLPPGQHLTRDFPVLSAHSTPHTPLATWSFALEAEDGTKLAT